MVFQIVHDSIGLWYHFIRHRNGLIHEVTNNLRVLNGPAQPIRVGRFRQTRVLVVGTHLRRFLIVAYWVFFFLGILPLRILRHGQIEAGLICMGEILDFHQWDS